MLPRLMSLTLWFLAVMGQDRQYMYEEPVQFEQQVPSNLGFIQRKSVSRAREHDETEQLKERHGYVIEGHEIHENNGEELAEEEKHSIFSSSEALPVNEVAFWIAGILVVSFLLEQLQHFLGHTLNGIEREIVHAQVQELQILGTLAWIQTIVVQSVGEPFPEEYEQLLVTWEFAHFVAFTAGVLRIIVTWHSLTVVRYNLRLRRHAAVGHEEDHKNADDHDDAINAELHGDVVVETSKCIGYICPSPYIPGIQVSNHGVSGLYGKILDGGIQLAHLWGRDWKQQRRTYEGGAWKTIRIWCHACLSDFVEANMASYAATVGLSLFVGILYQAGGSFGSYDNSALIFASFGVFLFLCGVALYQSSRRYVDDLASQIESGIAKTQGLQSQTEIEEYRVQFQERCAYMIAEDAKRLMHDVLRKPLEHQFWERRLVQHQVHKVEEYAARYKQRRSSGNLCGSDHLSQDFLEALQMVTGFHLVIWMIHFGPWFARKGDWAWFILTPLPDLIVLFYLVPHILLNQGFVIGLVCALMGAEDFDIPNPRKVPHWLQEYMTTPMTPHPSSSAAPTQQAMRERRSKKHDSSGSLL